jgi:colanic acid/amylovoran biosynthesis glycosyltransferase
MDKPLSLVYLIGTYPGLTTTFIDREIKILRRWEVDLQIVAVRRPPDGTPLSKDQQELQRGVIYLLPVASWLNFIAAHLYFAFLHPRPYFKTVVYLVTRPHPSLKFRFKTFLHFVEAVYAAYLLRRRDFYELHAHFVERAATLALVIGRLLNKPYSVSIHAGPDIFVEPILLREKIAEARHVVTCTLYNKSHVESIVGRDLSDKISNIHHGLDLSQYQPGPIIVNGKPLVISVGQLVERKGFVQLIRACYTLKNQGYDFSCHIVGRGPQQEELENLINQLALQDTVTLCGALPHEEVIEKYKQAVMFVLPCLKSKSGNMDGIPNVLAEAMVLQIPVISTDVSAIPELLKDQVNGLMVPSEDNAALVAAMARLLDDPGLRQALGKNGRQAIMNVFDVERNVRQFATTLWPVWFK